jgi:hypothetical protein
MKTGSCISAKGSVVMAGVLTILGSAIAAPKPAHAIALLAGEAVSVQSTFGANDEGWTSIGFPQPSAINNPATPSRTNAVTYVPNGGPTGAGDGFLRVNELQAEQQAGATGGLDYYHAPSRFLGNQLASLGHRLVWNSRANQAYLDRNADVVISDGTLVLAGNASAFAQSATAWSEQAITFFADSIDLTWTIAASTIDGGFAVGTVAAAQLETVLSNLTDLLIGIDASGKSDMDFDNPTLTRSVPEPSLPALLLLGAFGLGIARRIPRLPGRD